MTIENKNKNSLKNTQTCLSSITCTTDDFSLVMASTTTTTNATAEPQQQLKQQQQQQQQKHAHNIMRPSSNSSLAEGSACALTHQYHYIQYPAYYQLMHDRPQHAQHAQHAAATMTQSPTTCRCPCSCGNTVTGTGMTPANNQIGRHMHQHSSDDSQMAVAVIVHQQAGGSDVGTGSNGTGANQQVAKAKSEQSLLNHSYQALHGGCEDEKQLNLAETTSCDCDLECTCAVSLPPKSKHSGGVGMSALMLGADEITVSESDNNSTMVKRKSRDKKSHKWCHQDNILDSGLNGCKRKSIFNSSQIDIYSDGEGDGTDSCLKISNDGISDDDQRPPLPPRPPPRPRNVIVNMNAHRNGAGGIKKYVVWCLICGGFSCLLGILFLGVYFLLHSYTITVGNFETVPTFVPATLLILTGLCIMSLARRRNRYSYLIKLSGACGLISALTCALVTVTTTVLHMSRLQALRECEYAQKTRTCTCYSDMIESQVERVDKEGVRLVFDSLSDCGVVHGSLYSCLRAIFGLSVAGVLIAVFSCMLVYQLLSHERKKMYWEQLELRCRSLYTSQQGPQAPNMAAMVGGRANVCRCCEQCHAHRQVPLQPSAYPWDDGAEPRFWTGQPPGNFYSPNPGGDDLQNNTVGTCRGHGITANSRSRATGWSWPRMPWQRSSPVASNRFRQTPSSPDSQYGFSNNAQPPPTSGDVVLSEEQVFNGVPGTSLPYGVWGPPPPYSDPNSPARRGYYQFLHHPNGGCANALTDRQAPVLNGGEQHNSRMDCRSTHRTGFGRESQPSDASAFCAQTTTIRNVGKRQGQGNAFKTTTSKGDYENSPSDSDGGARDHCSNTLPTRKLKKRVEAGAKSIGPNSQSTQRVNVQHVFSTSHCASDSTSTHEAHAYHEPIDHADGLNNENFSNGNCMNTRSCVVQTHVATQRHKIGVENSAFQNSTECSANVMDGHAHGGHAHEHCDPTESEVYFADVSSCCNISVKNDNYYDEANQAQTELSQTSKHCQNHHASNVHHHQHHHHQHQQQQHQHNDNNSNVEDYLAQRFGKRENSIRSRLPFPQTCNEEYDGNPDINASLPNTTLSITSNGSNNSNNMQKEISRHSMCSVDSEAKTEFTDLSPSTPCGNNFIVPHCEPALKDTTSATSTSTSTTTTPRMPTTKTFVASFPYSSESQSLEAHRRSTRNISNEQQLLVTTEAQYEIINDASTCKPINFPTTQANVRSAKVGSQTPTRPTILRTSTTQASIKKSTKMDHSLEKNPSCYQSDVEWSDSNSCAKDRENL